jgi:hypothetical protein
MTIRLSLLVIASLLQSHLAAAPREERVQFQPGTDRATIRGTVKGDDYVLYKVNARDGQFLNVSMTTDNESSDFNIYIPGRGPGDEALFASAQSAAGRQYTGQLYKTGDHGISVFLNRNAARGGQQANFTLTVRITATAPEENAAAPAPSAESSGFVQEVSYGKMTFKVTSPAAEANNRATITPSGLEASNEPIVIDVEGFVVNVLCDDIDGDDSPEIAVITQVTKEEFGRAYLFSTFGKKSLGMVNFVDVTDSPQLKGYAGHDEYDFVENTFIRRFPIFTEEGKTGKTRQFQFKMKPGEAMKQLVLDRTVDY